MAKVRRSQVEVSLFPFLSILAAIIGILVMILCSVIISQIDPEGIEEVKKENQVNIDRQLQLDELELEKRRLQKLLEKANKLSTTKSNFPEQIKKLKVNIAAKKKQRQVQMAKNGKTKTISKTLALKVLQKKELLTSLKEMQKIQKLIEAALNKEKKRLHSKLKIVSTGSGVLANSIPTYIECTGKGITFIGEKNVSIARNLIKKNELWKKLIAKSKGQPKKVVLFLIRPTYEAVKTYNYIKNTCIANNVKMAKIPLKNTLPLSVGGK